ncbi:tetratricopeptide repeat protein [Gilvimarinus sp. DA14]|uniref:tetratricopeptide repeat protein n=1 Tax=Gilvimarinus sp. DA14 TaxID=2956798 RepID=UPI0020B80104|nr:tetratricopeptide repeat protein [Gilvimarinus sp. DA14]UTF61321.1 tetratricopeptide repeat protein [Gilvimarinus sp. DA14]
MKVVPKVAPVLVLAGLIGCASQAPTPESEAPAAEPVAKVEPAPEPVPARPFTSDTLYALLSAEVAGSRGRFDVALANYLQQAEQTGDPQVAERAYMISRYVGDQQAALSAATLWAEADPDNEEAQAAAILALIEADRLLEAFSATQKAHTRDNGALLQSIAANGQEITDTQREVLLEQYQQQRLKEPQNVPLLIGTGLLLQQQGRGIEALQLAERAMQLEPDNTHALVLNSGLLHELGRTDEAIALVETQLEQDPDNNRARLQYARLLTFSDLNAAQQQFQILADASPGDPQLQRALALIAEERGDVDTAETAYYALLEMNQSTGEAHFFLGKLAEQRGELDEALRHYQEVEPGENFYSATARVFAIYLQQNQPASADNYYRQLLGFMQEGPETDHSTELTLIYNQQLLAAGKHERALQLLNESLESNPEDQTLLYSRAMVHDGLGNLAQAEQDLRSIIEYDPDNAAALNALGYILTENTERYAEAYDYIKHALELQPNDPATIDSMGWVQYRLGNLEIALRYLERAMSAYPDHEIAAHLGEVLWVSGQQDEARSVWRQGLEIDPDSEYIHSTIKRLGIEPDSL